MGQYHILNGDCLADQLAFWVEPKIVFRECLVTGPIEGDNMQELLENRISYFNKYHNISSQDYRQKSIDEILKIRTFNSDDHIHLWFEKDLFCQVNMWAAMHLLPLKATWYVVQPIADSWEGFGLLNMEQLISCYDHKTEVNQQQKTLFKALWQDYVMNDWDNMIKNGNQLLSIHPFMNEVIKAHIDRFPKNNSLGRPQQTLQNILNTTDPTDFQAIFKQFKEIEGIYGFGDVQVNTMIQELKIQP